MTETKIITWSYDTVDYIGKQIKEYIESKCVDGWYCHQIQPILMQEYQGGNLRVISAVITLMRKL